MLAFTQPGSATTLPTLPSLDDLFKLPTTRPTGAADPRVWPFFTAAAGAQQQPATAGGATAWLKGNSTAVMVIAGALFALALFGGKRR